MSPESIIGVFILVWQTIQSLLVVYYGSAVGHQFDAKLQEAQRAFEHSWRKRDREDKFRLAALDIPPRAISNSSPVSLTFFPDFVIFSRF